MPPLFLRSSTSSNTAAKHAHLQYYGSRVCILTHCSRPYIAVVDGKGGNTSVLLKYLLLRNRWDQLYNNLLVRTSKKCHGSLEHHLEERCIDGGFPFVERL